MFVAGCEWCEAKARKVRQGVLAHYALPPASIPLVRFDGGGFSEVADQT